MAREIGDGIYWIQQCNPRSSQPSEADWYEPGREVHSSFNAYFVDGDVTLLFDTLSPAAEEQILEELRSLLGDRSLDYLVLSHPETPHAGNTFALLSAYPDATVVAPADGSTHELYHLDGAQKVIPGDSIDLGDHHVTFEEAYFVDHGMHIWMYERTADVLFTVDWMGFYHLDTECLRTAAEIESPVSVERLSSFHDHVFPWYRQADTAKTRRAIETIVDRYGDATVAPAHGLVIRTDAATYMSRLNTVIADLASEEGDR